MKNTTKMNISNMTAFIRMLKNLGTGKPTE